MATLRNLRGDWDSPHFLQIILGLELTSTVSDETDIAVGADKEKRIRRDTVAPPDVFGLAQKLILRKGASALRRILYRRAKGSSSFVFFDAAGSLGRNSSRVKCGPRKRSNRRTLLPL